MTDSAAVRTDSSDGHFGQTRMIDSTAVRTDSSYIQNDTDGTQSSEESDGG